MSQGALFVTGGSRGIGEAVVLAALSAGRDVAFTFHANEARANEVLARAKAEHPDRVCRAYRLDVRDSTAVESVVDQVVDAFETVDAVVANAGVNVNNLAVHMTDDEWRVVLDTNLTGSFFVARQFLTPFLGQGHGRLVFVSSLGAHGVSGQANYSASKAGLLGLSSALAKEYGRRGITSNVVELGFFDTDMTREGMSAQNREFWMKYCPQGRIASPVEAARVVLFLASDDASFVNGQSIPVNGGLDWAP